MISKREEIEFRYSLIDRLKSDILYHIGWGGRNLSEEKVKNIFEEIDILLKNVPYEPNWLNEKQLRCLKYITLETNLEGYDSSFEEDGIVLSKPVKNLQNNLWDKEDIRIFKINKNGEVVVESKLVARN